MKQDKDKILFNVDMGVAGWEGTYSSKEGTRFSRNAETLKKLSPLEGRF